MSLSETQFEAYAKRIADAVAGHPTAANGYLIAGYSKPNGEVFLRLAHRNHDKAIKNLKERFEYFVTNPLTVVDEADHETFMEHVLANLCGDGLEVEWES